VVVRGDEKADIVVVVVVNDSTIVIMSVANDNDDMLRYLDGDDDDSFMIMMCSRYLIFAALASSDLINGISIANEMMVW